jgi:integrase
MWYGTENANKFIEANPSVKKWMDKLPSVSSRSTFGQALQVFSEWAKLTPEQLMEEHRNGKDGYVAVDRLQDFLINGEVIDRRGKTPKVTKTATWSAKRKKAVYTAVRSYYAYNRAELPSDRAFKLTEQSRTAPDFLELDEARAIIQALKQPYRAMFTASLYGGMGRNELLMLNGLWPQIREQLKDSKAAVVKIDFGQRKSNPTPYYCFVPRQVFEPFMDSEKPPFVTRTGEQIAEGDLGYNWFYARKRAGIRATVRPHMIRDLWRTLCVKVGVQRDCAEFLMGHQIDTLQYNQIYRDVDFVRKEWDRLARYLESGVTAEHEERVAQLEGELSKERSRGAELEKKVADQSAMLGIVLKKLEGIAGEYGVEVPEAGPARKKARK